MVFNGLHVPYRTEGLLVVAADVVDVQQLHPRKGGVARMEPRSGPMSIILSSGTSEASVVTKVQF